MIDQGKARQIAQELLEGLGDSPSLMLGPTIRFLDGQVGQFTRLENFEALFFLVGK
jgi:hypothetical protein